MTNKVHKLLNSDGEIISDESNEHYVDLPEHVDNPYLNRNVQKGILGFRYEMKSSMLVVYSSVEAKTFCTLMRLGPLSK